MTMKSPFSLVAEAFGKLGEQLKAPDWLVDEMQHRVVLFLNHVLMQEPEAQARLARQQGRVVRVQWRDFNLQLAATPAGLCERVPEATPDLLLTVTDSSPLDLARHAVRGERPGVRIEGDVQFAAEVNWLVDHVRWDLEEDLARIVGDAPAHTIAQGARRVTQALGAFVARFAGVRAGSQPPDRAPS